jgi:predicted RNA-binding Zn ribbon-like protein
MPADTRPLPFFIAGHHGLDFLNTLAVPVDSEVEWLASGDDLLAWLRQAELVPENVLEGLRRHAIPGELDAAAARARSLRDWFKSFVRKYMGKSLPQDAIRELDPLNQLLRRDEEFGQIVVRDRRERADGLGFRWDPQRRWQSPETLLLPLARLLADLVCNEDFTYLKACEGSTCTLLFIDRTRGHARRWCSMAICGNRAKQTEHRRRAKKVRKQRP